MYDSMSKKILDENPQTNPYGSNIAVLFIYKDLVLKWSISYKVTVLTVLYRFLVP